MRRPSTRAERVAFVDRMRREIEEDERRHPPPTTTQAQRRRIVEVMKIEAGDLTPAPWERARTGPIDDAPWRVARGASIRAQHERFGRFGLALGRDRTIRCVRCREVVLAVTPGLPHAMGAPVSALALRHARETGCR